MYKLIRFYNKNRKKIIKTILIIVFIIGIIQLLDYFAEVKNEQSISSTNVIENNIKNENSEELISDKSLITGQKISSTKLERDTEIINEFVEKCNNQDFTGAYNLLTEECKEVMFPTLQDFYDIYYISTFNNEKRLHTIENWNGNIYQVRFSEDLLTTGKLDGNETKQDYITIVKQDEEIRLNINSYIGRENSNEVTEQKNIEVTVTSIDKYMDYEIYNLSIKNNSKNTILLDTSDDTKSVYLLDKNNMKYYFYNSEIVESELIIESEFTNKLQIKFNNPYISTRKINSLVFSKLVLNYEEYLNAKDITDFQNFYQLKIKI